MKNISIVTVVRQAEPRLSLMAKSLLMSLETAPADARVQWVIVDHERLRGPIVDAQDFQSPRFHFGDSLSSMHARRGAGGGYNGIKIDRVYPTRPGLSVAYNAGLERCTGDYVMFLDDCTVVTQGWLRKAYELMNVDLGWRCRQLSLVDLQVAIDQPITLGTRDDPSMPIVTPATVGGAWGASAYALAQVHGFDEAYDGEPYGADADLALRLSRTGIRFVTSVQDLAIRLTRTIKPERKGTCRENKRRLQDLIRERSRTFPSVDTSVGDETSTTPFNRSWPLNRAPDPVESLDDPELVGAPPSADGAVAAPGPGAGADDGGAPAGGPPAVPGPADAADLGVPVGRVTTAPAGRSSKSPAVRRGSRPKAVIQALPATPPAPARPDTDTDESAALVALGDDDDDLELS